MEDEFEKEYGEVLRSLILKHAASHPSFRKKLHQLRLVKEQLDYPDVRTYTHLMTQAMTLINAIASESGLFEAISWGELSDVQSQQFLFWMLDKSPELSFYAENRAKEQQRPSKSAHKQASGFVFLSWTVSSPRERAAMMGVKDNLDDFGVKYYDFTEHRVDSSLPDSEEIIRAKIREAVDQSNCSIELTSSEFQGEWIEFERGLLRKKKDLVRIILHLDKEFGVETSDEFRVLRLDFSDGRLRGHMTIDQRWQRQASDASYYQTQDYLNKCKALGQLVGRICDAEEPIKIIDSLKVSETNSRGKPTGFEESHRLLSQDKYQMSSNYKVILGWATIIIGGLVYLTQGDILTAVVLAMIGGSLLNNFFVLLFPKRVSESYLRGVITTTYIVCVIYLALTFLEAVRLFLDRFGIVGRYGFAIFLGISFVLALNRQRQLKSVS